MYIHTKNMRGLRFSDKLSPRFVGPFVVQQVNYNSVQVKLPDDCGLNPVVPLTSVRVCKNAAVAAKTAWRQVDDTGDEHRNLFDVYEIREHKIVNGRLQFLTAYNDFDGLSWQPLRDFRDIKNGRVVSRRRVVPG